MQVGQPLILMTLLASMPGNLPNSPGNYDRAVNESRRALSEDPETKGDFELYGENGLKLVTQYTGLSQSELSYVGYMIPLATQTISTKPFKNLQIRVDKNTMVRPEINYYFGPYPTSNYALFIIKTF